MCCGHHNRREFLGVATGVAAGLGLTGPMAAVGAVGAGDGWDPDRAFDVVGKPLRIKPILMYNISRPRKMTSWKGWGSVRSDQAADQEVKLITKELSALAKKASFPLEVLPVTKVKSAEQAAQAAKGDHDAVVVYPATGSGTMLRACIPSDKNAIIFVRHRSGPVYYWYEALSTRYLKKNTVDGDVAQPGTANVTVDDVVVDDMEEMLWRLRGLYGVRNMVGCRIVALGGPAGKYAGEAPQVARERFGLDIVDVSYDELGKRIKSAMADAKLMAQARQWTEKFLSMPNTKLNTEKNFVVNCFVLYDIFKQFMREANAPAFTIKGCMSTVLPMSQTTACLTLGLMNDEGLLAFCESDFVIIPAGILARFVSGNPAFLHNSTFPHAGMVTCAHCTGPRRMNADRYEPVEITTHYESEYGAAPKVEMPKGQMVTFIDPEYATCRWLGFTGTVEDNPYYEICRSQQDVRIHGKWQKLMNEARDSHWIMIYGDHLNAVGYAARKLGVDWETITEA